MCEVSQFLLIQIMKFAAFKLQEHHIFQVNQKLETGNGLPNIKGLSEFGDSCITKTKKLKSVSR